MANLWKIAVHDLRVTLKDRSAVLWMLLFPVVFATFFGLVMGGGTASTPVDGTVSLSVVDLDGSIMSSALIDHLKDDRLDLVLLSPSQERPADTVRTLVIPEGFERMAVAGEQTTLVLEKEPDTSAEAALVAQARIVRSATRLIGGLIMEEVSGSVDATADSEPLVTVNTSWAGSRQGPPSGFSQSVPGNATMFVLLITLTYGAASVSGERQSGVLRRLVTSPVSRWEIVGGKILGRFVISGLQVTALVGVAAIARFWVNIDLGGNLFGVWAVLLVYGACVAPLGVALGAWFVDQERAANIGTMMTMAMAAFGGCWWPLEIVSGTLQTIAMAFPTTWAMRALHGLISFGHGWDAISPSLGVLVLFGLAFTTLAVRSLRVE